MNIASGSEEPNDKINVLLSALTKKSKKLDKDNRSDLIAEMLEEHRRSKTPNDGLKNDNSPSTRSVAMKNVYKIREEFELLYSDDIPDVHVGICGEWDHVRQFLENRGTIERYQDNSETGWCIYDGQWPGDPAVEVTRYTFLVRNEESEAKGEGPCYFGVEVEALWTPDSTSV